jgi:hypothetical protein
VVASAARRLVFLLAIIGGPTALISLALGGLTHSSASRSVSLGFYLVGSFLLIGGFFTGNRGPLRMKNPDEGTPFWGSRAVRWATEAEREDAINTSAVFVTVGLLLVLLGIVVDNRYSLF